MLSSEFSLALEKTKRLQIARRLIEKNSIVCHRMQLGKQNIEQLEKLIKDLTDNNAAALQAINCALTVGEIV